MLIGPVFTREITISPRRPQTFIIRSVYSMFLLLLVSTAWLVITGTQLIQDTGDFARFATTLFMLVAPLQLVLTLFFSAMLAAGSVAQEKDRKTLILLLLTRMNGSELVLGKLLASILNVFVMVSISLPVLMLTALLGGVSYPQIVRVVLVTLFAAFACGSLGSCVALSKEKTFQSLATTVLILVLWFGVWETIGLGVLGTQIFGFSAQRIAETVSPWSAIIAACRPVVDWTQYQWSSDPQILYEQFLNILGPTRWFLLFSIAVTFLINCYAIAMVRVWNPSRELRGGIIEEDTWKKETESIPSAIVEGADYQRRSEEEQPIGLFGSTNAEAENLAATPQTEDAARISHAAPGAVRHVWDNPVIWREICTQAYGKKMWIIRAAYLLFFVMCAVVLHGIFNANPTVTISQLAGPMVPLFLLSLFLVNAQAVTSLTSERDGGTLDLLLASDITPKEFVYGKIGGVFWNVKEMVVLPLAICFYLYWKEAIGQTPLFFLFTGMVTLYAFVAMIGIYIGMQYQNTRSAVATSLGIIFFLFIGIATCMWIMIAFSGSFETQLQPFVAFMVGGAIGLYVTLGTKNPSSAILLASFVLPIATFYAITSIFLGQYHLVFIAVLGAYGFTTAAMLIPAIDEFDVATGRTTAD